MALGRDLDRRPAPLGTGRRVAALVANAVDLDRHVEELPGAEAPPNAVRAQRQRHALLGPPLDPDDLGPALAGDQQGVELFQVGVEAVRGRHCLEEAKAAAGKELGRHDLKQGNIKCRHVN